MDRTYGTPRVRLTLRGSMSRVSILDSGSLKASWVMPTSDLLRADAPALLGPVFADLHGDAAAALARLRDGEWRSVDVSEAG